MDLKAVAVSNENGDTKEEHKLWFTRIPKREPNAEDIRI